MDYYSIRFLFNLKEFLPQKQKHTTSFLNFENTKVLCLVNKQFKTIIYNFYSHKMYNEYKFMNSILRNHDKSPIIYWKLFLENPLPYQILNCVNCDLQQDGMVKIIFVEIDKNLSYRISKLQDNDYRIIYNTLASPSDKFKEGSALLECIEFDGKIPPSKYEDFFQKYENVIFNSFNEVKNFMRILNYYPFNQSKFNRIMDSILHLKECDRPSHITKEFDFGGGFTYDQLANFSHYESDTSDDESESSDDESDLDYNLRLKQSVKCYPESILKIKEYFHYCYDSVTTPFIDKVIGGIKILYPENDKIDYRACFSGFEWWYEFEIVFPITKGYLSD